jgi:hypothetical protein
MMERKMGLWRIAVLSDLKKVIKRANENKMSNPSFKVLWERRLRETKD